MHPCISPQLAEILWIGDHGKRLAFGVQSIPHAAFCPWPVGLEFLFSLTQSTDCHFPIANI